MKKKQLIAVACTGGLLGAFCITSLMMAKYGMSIKRQTLDEAYKWQSEHEDVSYFDGLQKTEYEVTSYDGYVLHVVLCKDPEVTTDRYVILSHGYTDNRYGNLKYMKMYLDRGYICIIYDLRGHGKNEPTFCTYGIREGKDLCALIEDTYKRYGEDIKLGLHGESLGSATTISALGGLENPDRILFAVADCGFADIENVMVGGMKQMHLPKFMFYTASVAARFRYGYAMTDMRPIDALKNNHVPICFIHGEEDTFIPPSNSQRMHDADPGCSELHLIPDAGHAESVLKHPDQYQEILNTFLDKVE